MIQNQVSVVVDRIFDLPLPSNWKYIGWPSIYELLMEVRHDSLSPSVRKSMQVVISQKVPDQLRKGRSLSFLCELGRTIIWEVSKFPELVIELFTVFDEIAVEFVRDGEGLVEGLDVEDVQQWKALRQALIKSMRQAEDVDGGVAVPEHLRLPDRYFDELPGHGPLPFDMSKYPKKGA